ncbi:MAG TPA: transglycosylase family protein, partial [Thermoleophilaceae bacterium]|nr:transglycosylase family protein [Thermoleophilaceae bacterium]
MGSHDLWQRSLERSIRRRELAAAARREISRRRRASVAATAAVAVAPIATSVSSSGGFTASAADTATQPAPHGNANQVLLEYGSTGPSVREVQRSLDLVVDGIYGPRTKRAVFQFQQRVGLHATGKVDMLTWVALLRHMRSAPASTSSAPPVASERQVGPAPQLRPTPTLAPEAATKPAAKPATERKPAHKRRAKAAKHAPAAPHRVVKREKPKREAPEREKSARRPAPSKAPAAQGSVGRILDAIATCESGGNPSAVSSGGQYRGMYQFDQQTWESLGGTGDPADASAADQTERAAVLYAQRGASAWPTCGPAAVQSASASR